MRRAGIFALLAAAICVPSAAAAKLTIRVTSVSLSAKRTDVAPKGTSKGDTIEMRDRLLNAAAQFGRAKGAVVGSDHATLTFTGPATAVASGVAVLPGGTVRLQGDVVVRSKSIAIPVTGGTGRFARARGYVVVGPGDTRALNTFTLTIPSTPVA